MNTTEKLEAENAKLLVRLTHMELHECPACANVADLQESLDENAKLRELVLKNWYIALSERETLRAHDIDPDGGTYMAALDDEIATAKDRMCELGIEVTGK